MKKLWMLTILAVALSLACGPVAFAADYPNKPIKIVVPYQPGGSADLSARIFAKYAEQEIGGKIAIINTAGASGSVGTRDVARSAPDGYTFLWNTPSMFTAYQTGVQPFTWDSMTPISPVVSFYKVFVVHKDAKWQTLQELLADVKANPETIKYGVSFGAASHFEALGFEIATGAKFMFVAGGGDAQQVTSVLGKHIDAFAPSDTIALQYIADGSLRPLGVSGRDRLPTLPDVPTYREQGIDFDFIYDIVLYAPGNLPKELQERWNRVVQTVLTNETALAELAKIGMYPNYHSLEDTYKFLIETDVNLYRSARLGGLRPDKVE